MNVLMKCWYNFESVLQPVNFVFIARDHRGMDVVDAHDGAVPVSRSSSMFLTFQTGV